MIRLRLPLAVLALFLPGCLRVVETADEPEPVAEPEGPPPPTAAELEEASVTACEGGEVDECVKVANTASDPVVVMRAHERSCELKLADGCRQFADLYIKTKGNQLARYMEAVSGACDGDHAASCGELAKAHLEGWLAAPDPNAAAEVGERACQLEDEQGCRIATVARTYLEGPEPKPLPERFGNVQAHRMIALNLQCKGSEKAFADQTTDGSTPVAANGAVHLAGLAAKKKEMDACGPTWGLAQVRWKVRKNRIRKATGVGPVGECVADVIQTLPAAVPAKTPSETKLSWECEATLVLGY